MSNPKHSATLEAAFNGVDVFAEAAAVARRMPPEDQGTILAVFNHAITAGVPSRDFREALRLLRFGSSEDKRTLCPSAFEGFVSIAHNGGWGWERLIDVISSLGFRLTPGHLAALSSRLPQYPC